MISSFRLIPRLDISFPLRRQLQFCFGREYAPRAGEFLLNHARAGIVLALRSALPQGGRVGVLVYNCHTVANAVVSAGFTPVFLDVDEELWLDLNAAGAVGHLDAVVVTNLFGIRNDVAAVRSAFPGAVVIVDNAHGYGLPAEGDFTVYSINQGKYPALGEGGLLEVCNPRFEAAVRRQYDELPGYGFLKSWMLFETMTLRAIIHLPLVYGMLTVHLKAGRANDADHTPVRGRKMCPGVSRIYNAWLSDHSGKPLAKPFMDVVRTDEPSKLIAEYRSQGIEAETHFKNCIRWAEEFGYLPGSCPCSERLVHHLVMVPNYYKK